MGPINISLYDEYYIIICNHYKLNEVGSDISSQLTSPGTGENPFLGVTKRMLSDLLMSLFLLLYDSVF